MEEAEGRAAAGWPGWKHYAEIVRQARLLKIQYGQARPLENATGRQKASVRALRASKRASGSERLISEPCVPLSCGTYALSWRSRRKPHFTSTAWWGREMGYRGWSLRLAGR